MKKFIHLWLAFLVFVFASCNSEIINFETINRAPSIFPDYAGITIPPNIAPLNFRINEPGIEYEARIFAKENERITIRSTKPIIKIEINEWHKMLQENRGAKLYVKVFTKKEDGSWQKFQTITNEIARENIDSHLAYRLINSAYVLWNNLGIYQRNLENFDEKPILENMSFEYGCLNCHSFCKNDPKNMMMHIRATHGGTIISQNNKLKKIDTKNKYTINAGAYPCWHPGGKHIAFSTNVINQNFSSGSVRIEVADKLSDIIVYDIEKNTITTSPKVLTSRRENLPVWSPDGKYIYFISAPEVSGQNDRIYSKYDLMRIAFDVNTNIWGQVDTVLSSREFGKSISFPKISPNGRFLMFCGSDYGYFTIHYPAADIYLINLETGAYHKMEINSPQTDSYHCFSSTGRWFVFSSKRLGGLFTRPFFSYFDENGNASKPFVLPQENPEFYDTFIKNYNIPELITGEVDVSPMAIRDKVMEDAIQVRLDNSVDTTYMKQHLLNNASE